MNAREDLPSMPETYSDAALLGYLEPVAKALLERHLQTTEEWFPHELVPYSIGEDFDKEEQEWDPETSPRNGINLNEDERLIIRAEMLELTDLPNHFRARTRLSPADHPLRSWHKVWAAERGRHEIALQNLLCVTNAVDLRDLERARMRRVSRSDDTSTEHLAAPLPEALPPTLADCLIHFKQHSLEAVHRHRELSHRLSQSAGQAILTLIANDELRHYDFFCQLTNVAFSFDAYSMIIAGMRYRVLQPDAGSNIVVVGDLGFE